MILQHLDRLNDPIKYTIVLASQSSRRLQLLHQMGIKRVRVLVSFFEENLPHGSYEYSHDYAVATASMKMKAILTLDGLLETLKQCPIARKNPDEYDGEDPATLGETIIIIAADSVVSRSLVGGGTSGSHILEKATTAEEAKEFIASLTEQGSCRVVTGMCIGVVQNGAPAACQATHGDLPEFVRDGVSLEDGSRSCHVTRLSPTIAFGGSLARADVEDVYVSWDATTVHMSRFVTKADISAYVREKWAWEGKAGAFGIQDLAATFITGIHGDYYNVMGLPIARVGAIMAYITGRQIISESSSDVDGQR